MAIWDQIKALEGQELATLDRGYPFLVRVVEEQSLLIYLRSTKKERRIDRSEIEGPFNDLWLSKVLTLAEIRDMHSRSNSAYVAALLARIAGVQYSLRPIRVWLAPNSPGRTGAAPGS